MMRISILMLLLGVPWLSIMATPSSKPLFPVEFKEGLPYKRWRIPLLVVAPDNSLLAFSEGRVDGGGANGNIDIILKRSTDNGQTWGSNELVADAGIDTLVQFCPVVDQSTKTLWLMFARNVNADTEKDITSGKGTPSRIFMTHSKDSGRTWAKPQELTKTLTRKNWTWGGGAPTVGIQLKSGRLLIPSYHAVLPNSGKRPIYESHMVYSDDHGKTWKLGETVTSNVGECNVAERRDGTLYYNSRSQNFDNAQPTPSRIQGWRTIAESDDQGVTWKNVKKENALYDAPCQGFLHVLPDRGGQKPVWIFTHPAGPHRQNLVARISYDEGKTWPGFRRLHSHSSEYSSLTTMPNGKLGCLFEIWDHERRTHVIRFTQFPKEWLLEDPVADQLPKVQLKQVRKVEGVGEDHNAFTDLVRFKGKIYLAFRKSEIGHGVYPDSQIIIRSSEDEGMTWLDVYRFSIPDRDTRDPHFLIFKEKLFVYTGTWDARPLLKNQFQLNDHVGYAVATIDGKTWTPPRLLEGTHGHYIWRAATNEKQAYLCARRVKDYVRTTTRAQRAHLTEQVLLTSEEGWVWKHHAMVQPDYGNETAYRIEEDGTLWGVARTGYGPAQLIRSSPPYQRFQRMALDRPMGGPMLAKWNDLYITGGRNTLYGKRVCALYWLAEDRLHPILELPSGGDCSYPGFVQLDENRALVSYYSSHEGYPRKSGREPPSSIFVAELELEK